MYQSGKTFAVLKESSKRETKIADWIFWENRSGRRLLVVEDLQGLGREDTEHTAYKP